MGVGAMGYGGRYVEPQGTQNVINHNTGETCEIKYRTSGWRASSKDQSVEAIIKDSNGIAKFEITGKYTSHLYVKNLQTGQNI